MYRSSIVVVSKYHFDSCCSFEQTNFLTKTRLTCSPRRYTQIQALTLSYTVSATKVTSTMKRIIHQGILHPTSCLLSRAKTVARGEIVRKEVKHVAEVLKANGYRHRSIGRENRKRRNQSIESACHVSGLSEDLRRILRRFDMRTVFTRIFTLRQQLTMVKDVDPLLTKAGVVVYRVPCSCGKEYIGDTKRALGTRIKKHQSATRRGNQKSAIVEHVLAEQHHPIWIKHQ